MEQDLRIFLQKKKTIEKISKEYGLIGYQMCMIIYLGLRGALIESQGIRGTKLAEELGEHKIQITRWGHKLAEKGLIERVYQENKNIKFAPYRLTEKGLEAYNKINF